MSNANDPSGATAAVRHASRDQFATIIDAFAKITWPASADTADQLLSQLGWERVERRVARPHLFSGDDLASVGFADGGAEGGALFDFLSFFATDATGATNPTRVLEIYRTMITWVNEIAGSAVQEWEPSSYPNTTPDFPFTWWRLPSGGVVRLSFIEGVVTMELGSRRTGERYERERKFPELRWG